MALTAYPVHGKKKSFDICLAFVRGAGGQIGTTLREGDAFFYGVDATNSREWEGVLSSGQTYWYCDNSYFDASRQRIFRVTRNALQHSGLGSSDGKRFKALGLDIAPWRKAGSHVVVCPQSDHFMHVIAGYPGNWLDETVSGLRQVTDREIRVRPWSGNKSVLSSTLSADLVGAHALVTWSSAAAVTAILAGVPVIAMGQCAASTMSAGAIEDLENLPMRDDRERWASVLADNEWTLDEFRSGAAWRSLNAEEARVV
jgi:hypothetical protein